MFHDARLRLTAWYLCIIMLVSVLFSIAFYNLASREIQRVIRVQELRTQILNINNQSFAQSLFHPRSLEDLQEARQRLAILLLLINEGIFAIAGGAAYFLSGKTLMPIKEMVEEQNRFITDSSHELRTPLTSLRSEIEVALRNKELTLAQAKKLLESNLEETLNLQTLSDRLLELSQSEGEIRQKDMERLSILKIINTAIKKVEPLAKKKRVKITSRVKDALVMGFADRLTEVFTILLDNAVKYSERKGIVELDMKKRDGRIEVFVIDHGVGIANEDITHIFDRFWRAEKSRFLASGYGLGLSIAKKIIEAHYGFISVKSEPGRETVFLVSLISA